MAFGPVFFAPSKAVYGNPVGLERLAETASALNIPVFALEGSTKAIIFRSFMATGANGIALIFAIMTAEQPQAATAIERQPGAYSLSVLLGENGLFLGLAPRFFAGSKRS
jgi:thiamine monophosphate synthase